MGTLARVSTFMCSMLVQDEQNLFPLAGILLADLLSHTTNSLFLFVFSELDKTLTVQCIEADRRVVRLDSLPLNVWIVHIPDTP